VKQGQIINGYHVLQNFSTAGSGLSKWTFAQKNSRIYFLKEFLSPVYPTENSPGNAETKERKRKACDRFERRTRGLMKAIPRPVAQGGNLVVAEAFFRSGPKYYKVTAKVDAVSIPVAQIATLSEQKKVLFLKTICHSLCTLHAVNVVHGDLRPANILVKETATGDYAGKMIDFDSSFFASKPPAVDEFISDPLYYAPEVGRYIERPGSVRKRDIHTAADVFSLGLLFCEYLTGVLPKYDRENYRYPYVAVAAGEKLAIVDEHVPQYLRMLTALMLSADPQERPDISKVFATLQDPILISVVSEKSTAAAKATSGKIKGTLLSPEPKIEGPVESDETVVLPDRRPSKLKGTLIDR
jgi:serine/threonine protein kinase